MALKINGDFKARNLEARTKAVPVPAQVAEAFFKTSEAIEWTMRGLSGPEFAKVETASIERLRKVMALQKDLRSKSPEEQAEISLSAMGLSEKETPEQVITMQELVYLGSEDPKLDRQQMIDLFYAFPIFARSLATTVNELTSQGYVLGKPKPTSHKKE